MFNLKKVLLEKPSDDTSSSQTPFERLQIATCVVLLEVAQSDYEFSSIEKATITSILKKEFQISDEAAEELMAVAKKKREENVDVYEFTRLINQHYSREERMKIIEWAWKIIYADNKLDMYEDHLVHVLAKLLRLRHDELIEAKLKILKKAKT